MTMRSVAAVALALGLGFSGLGLGSAAAQTAPTTRNPVLGDPGVTPPPAVHRLRHRRHAAAVAASNADKQPAGTENGNQPDRASAGGGAR